ncbi:MAG: hypothetical protein SFU98_18030 [Leptospiraceae bacterium]|nr:hypothetical protein [Leptospiraceae bacterium]
MSESVSQFYKVLEYAPSLQSVQGMESRDFAYKGIFKLFTCITEWTEKYLANKMLPNAEQLAREIGLERERIEAYIQELCFKSPTPMVKKITTVVFDPNNTNKTEMISQVLQKNSVFARPPSLDAGSAQRYVNGCNEGSIEAIKKAIQANRIPWKSEKHKDFIFSKINANKLSESYASSDIANLFNCQYDVNKQQKEMTVNLHLKPVLKKLVDDKVLLFFRNENAPKSGNKSIFLYNNKDEIMERIEIYIKYLRQYIVPSFQKLGVVNDITEDDYKNFTHLAENLLKYMDQSYGDQKCVLEELVILGNFYESYREELAKKELKEKVNEVVRWLETANKLTEINSIRINGEPIPKDLIPSIYSHEMIIHTDYDDGKSLYEFVLHRKSTSFAVDNAKRLYETTDNDTELRVLQRMNISVHLDSTKRQEFQNTEFASLFKYLPMLTRLWRTMLGNIYVTKPEADLIRAQKEIEQKKRIAESRAKAIAKEKERLIVARMKSDEEKNKESKQSDSPTEKTIASMPSFEEEKKLKEVLKSITSILDEAWDKKLKPDREYLLQQLEGAMTEDELITYLKKNFSKEIFSFQVKSVSGNPTKFKWPILITKNYVKRKGRALLDLAVRESDEERKDVTPDQSRFDFYNSLEEFLLKVLGKT